ncbi:hypothetical protein DLNHIDIE_03386 [Acidithiobacillus thiooxidans ATCC 19377]|uniref:Uncharacterized protein n=1 Tax=Acidithiobacillus thiooxidans ATCC 19377 TaxID=637390 RepID=A0A543PZ30_ACITH|nr:hypothetical protein DLNHIDIE_03386 [Acidithiobacillus thiooxidans ATCC 19377]
MVACGIFSANQTPTPRQGTPETVAKQPKKSGLEPVWVPNFGTLE